MLLSSCMASSVSGHTESLQGVLQEGGSAPFASLLLVTPARKYWEITGPLQKELRSFIGLEVKVTGPLRPTLKTLVGARGWVVGKQEQEKLEVTRFGVIRQ